MNRPALENEIREIRVNLKQQSDLVGQLERSLGLPETPETPETPKTPDPETPDIIRDLTENFNPSDILTLLEIAHLSLKWPKDRSGLGDILDLSDQYLETLGLTLSGILSDKLETL